MKGLIKCDIPIYNIHYLDRYHKIEYIGVIIYDKNCNRIPKNDLHYVYVNQYRGLNGKNNIIISYFVEIKDSIHRYRYKVIDTKLYNKLQEVLYAQSI